ncbi:MAG: HAD hydrolase family protein [Deltaproteobacteria bacterium]|nr:HAD hydrolase family protein [Deltaproteobacteria bacterium]
MKYKEKLKKIRMILLDVDGVLTDGRVIQGIDGLEIMEFHVHDGVGIILAKKAGYLVGIISGRDSKIIHDRGVHLGVDDIYINTFHKIDAYKQILKKHNLKDENICFIGDELLDLPLLERVGFAAAPSDAIEDVKEKVHYVTLAKGGHGAVREIVELLLKVSNKKEKILKEVLRYE